MITIGALRGVTFVDDARCGADRGAGGGGGGGGAVMVLVGFSHAPSLRARARVCVHRAETRSATLCVSEYL